MGEKWKSLSEEQKQPYNDKAAADKDRFQKEMDAWSAPCPTQPGTDAGNCRCNLYQACTHIRYSLCTYPGTETGLHA